MREEWPLAWHPKNPASRSGPKPPHLVVFLFLRKRPKNEIPGGLSRALANARLNVRQERSESALVVLIAPSWHPDRTRRAVRGADVGLQRRPAPRYAQLAASPSARIASC
jgi:hypothetical protein